MKYEVMNTKAEKTGEVTLNPEIFCLETRVDILSRVITWQLAKRRSGNHKTKQVGDVRGSTKKIYRQKGTGNARHGSKRQVQFRGGCVVFGPLVRSHAYGLQKKVRKLGLKMALSSKCAAKNLIIIDNYGFDKCSTKAFKELMGKFQANSALLIDSSSSANSSLVKSASNVHGFDVISQIGANVYDIIRKDKLFISTSALKELEERLV